jgi:hypothetical protein
MKIFLMLLTFVFIFFQTSCSPVGFSSNPSTTPQTQTQNPSPAPPSASAPAPVPATPVPPTPQCSGDINHTSENLRIIFMVDNSGSTLQTDPSQFFRVQTIQNFLAKYSSKKNFTYSFGYFGTDTFLFDVQNQKFKNVASVNQVPKMTFGNSNDLAKALSLYSGIQPDGETNYALALSRIQSMILQDEILKTPWNYVLVFMSDGQPTDLNTPAAQNLRVMIRSLQGSAQQHRGFLTVSTVLFDPASDWGYFDSVNNLSAMADEGKGQFVDTNKISTGSLQIDDIISVPGPACP